MPFWPGSEKDRQSRRAVISNDSGQYAGVLPQLSSKDAFFWEKGEVQVDWPNPSFAVLGQQTRVARTAADVGQYDTPLPAFIGKDQFYDGAGYAPDFDYPNPSFAVIGRQALIAARASDFGQWASPIPELIGPLQEFPPGAAAFDLAPRGPARATPDVYGISEAFPQVLLGQDAFNAGAQSFDLPVPAAPRSRDYSFTAAFFHGLDGKDARAAGAQSYDLPLAHLIARRARDYTIAASFPLELVGKDQFNPGQSISGNAPAGAPRASTLSEPGVNLTVVIASTAPVIPPGQSTLATDIPPRAIARSREYGFAASFFHGLDGQDALATGAQLSGNAPASPRRASDYSWLQAFALETIGPEQQFPLGQAVFDLAPVSAARARDYTFAASFPLYLIGQDATNAGAQLSGNAPAGAPRARDYTYTASFPLELIGQDQFNPGKSAFDLPVPAAARARDYSWLHTLDLNTLGPAQQFPLGWQIFDLPTPPAALRARDYSFSAVFFHGLDGKDALTVGAQLSGNAPAGPLRASTLSECGSNQIPLLTSVAPSIPPGLSTAASELFPRAIARAREYGQTAGFPLELIGKDQFNAGQPSLDAQYRTVPRARDYTIAASFPLELIGKDVFPNGVGGQVQDDWQLPPRAAPRSFAVYDPGTNAAILAPVPQIPNGAQSFDLPVPAQPRARDYTFVASFPLYLRGKDQFNTGQSALDAQYRTAPRARDYSWLQTLPLHLVTAPVGESTAATELSPRGPARAVDYTFLGSLKPYLIGQDRLYGAPGEAPAYDWQLPPRQAPRLRDYTLAITAPYGSGIPPRDLLYTLGVPSSKWRAGNLPPTSHWVAGALPPNSHWVAGPPRQ